MIRQLETSCWVLDADGVHWGGPDEAAGALEAARAEGFSGAVDTVLLSPCWVAQCDVHIDDLNQACTATFGNDEHDCLHARTRAEMERWIADDEDWIIAEDGTVRCGRDNGHG